MSVSASQMNALMCVWKLKLADSAGCWSFQQRQNKSTRSGEETRTIIVNRQFSYLHDVIKVLI